MPRIRQIKKPKIRPSLEAKEDLMPLPEKLYFYENIKRLYTLLNYVVAVMAENFLLSEKTTRELGEWQGKLAAELGIDTPEG